jgi:ABC-type nickel/cobalt efflux system permease component RcnA
MSMPVGALAQSRLGHGACAQFEVVAANRPNCLAAALGIAKGLLPDPAALALLLAALSSGKVMLGLATVLVFSLGLQRRSSWWV